MSAVGQKAGRVLLCGNVRFPPITDARLATAWPDDEHEKRASSAQSECDESGLLPAWDRNEQRTYNDRCRTQECDQVTLPMLMSAFHPLWSLVFRAKQATMSGTRPTGREVGARIRVKAEHADDAAAAFNRERLAPIYVDHRSDGAVWYWFGKLGETDLAKATKAIPADWYALTGIIR